MALFALMTVLRDTSAIAKRAIIFVLLVAVVTSGVPLVEVHAHEHAHLGHGHAPLDHAHASDGFNDISSPAEDTDDTPTLHAHLLYTPALTLVEMSPADPVVVMNKCDETGPRFRPPDDVIDSLYRPPIA